ncbi:hypothetical protein BAMTA208_03675 [Bacillus amyloliquefaciens TA208]|nr:hypothetical protein BAMTA208_03675 [Bacillus amyloliquefaciens TA208]
MNKNKMAYRWHLIASEYFLETSGEKHEGTAGCMLY